jgi:hypothetical protein
MDETRQQVPIAEHEQVLAELERLRAENDGMKMEFSNAGGVGRLQAKISDLQAQLELAAREKMKVDEENVRLKECSLEDRTRTDRVIEVTNIVAASLQSNVRLTELIFSRLDLAAMGQSIPGMPQGVDTSVLTNLRSGR